MNTLRYGRITWISVLIAGIVSGGLGAIRSSTRASADDAKPTDGPAQKFFAKHCQSCHRGEKPKGDFLIDSLSLDFADKENRLRWLAVLKQVKAGTMPPKGKPRPPAQEAQALADWISGRAAATESTAQGRVVLRRLNRAEYANTVRDLLGVSVDLED
ncbi:MAG: DUF1587 domain-containing protein, partial [Planctomycetaceae bacterium]|nr:DUF1587 domain-containing protein [Planctomycetaceae bacterium]